MRFTRSNGTAPWRVDCEDFGTSAAAAIVDTKTGKKVAFAVDQIALGFPDSYLNLSHGDLMIDALNVHEATGLTPSQLLQKTGGSTATAPITRLDWLGEEGMKEFDDGEYVFYADHQQTVAQLQARVAELEAALREGTDTLRSLGNMPDYLVHDDAWDKEQVARKIVAYTQLLGS